MTESAANPGVMPQPLDRFYRWEEPDVGITVHLKPEVVDRLQADVLHGSDSGPHDGNEVGGILLGKSGVENGRIRIVVEDFVTVSCERQNGRVYAVTSRDPAKFEAILAQGSKGEALVGHYRSHNRSGLFLSADDVSLIPRYFPESDKLFLIVKTLPNRACTVGFFFWKEVEIQSEFTNSEVPLIPITVRAVGQHLSAGDPVDGGRCVSPAIAAKRSEWPRNALWNWMNGGERRLLIAGILFIVVAATLTVAVVRDRTPRIHDEGAGYAPLTGAKGVSPAPGAIREASWMTKKSAATTSDTPRTVHRQTPDQTSKPSVREGEPPVSTESARAVAAPPPVRRKMNIPPGSKSQPTPAELPVDSSRSDTAVARPLLALQLPVSANPITPAIAAPRTNPGLLNSPNPPASVEAHQLIGPQVIHEVTPAIPAGVGPSITTDVQLNVEVNINDKGKVTRARIASTKGAAAALQTIEGLKAAQLFRFRPTQQNGHNVSSVMVLTFHFEPTAK
jgi:hypothetical protein